MILERKSLDLTEIQKKIIKSGWGTASVDDVIVERMIYQSDELKVNGYLAYPKYTGKKYPCVIWCRGGFRNAGSLDDFNAQGILGQLASWGYVVFESQYRGNVGAEGKDEFGGSDLNDVSNLVPLANEFNFADKNNWGIEGWSRGGMMTYLTLTKNHNFKVAISTGGISNVQCSVDESNFMKKLLERNHHDLDENFCRERTILNHIDKYSRNTPTLLIHGTKDERIPAHHSLDLSYKFLENNIEHKLVLLENGDHFLRNHKSEVDDLRKRWFKKYLG